MTALAPIPADDAPTASAPSGGLPLDEVFRRYAPYVAAIGCRLLGRDEEVDDLVSDVFVEAVRGLGQLREPGAVKGWLATVAVRLARRKLKRRRWLALFRVDDHASYEHVADRAASPDDRIFLARVYALLDAVPVDERLPWTLHHLEGETLESAAALCECSLATVKRRIRAAHDKIEKGLQP